MRATAPHSAPSTSALQRCLRAACLTGLVMLLLPAGAYAWTVTVHVHGAGAVSETTPRALMNCAVGPAGKSEASVTDCVAGTTSGLYNSFDVVNLRASVPQDSFDRGWRFLKYVDSGAGGESDQLRPAGHHRRSLQRRLPVPDLREPGDGPLLRRHRGAAGTTISDRPAGQHELDERHVARSTLPAIPMRATSAASTGRPSPQGPSRACGSPSDKSETYATTANGAYRFHVQAKDPSGNVVPRAASRGWIVDTVAPAPSISGGPAQGSTVSSTTASFTIGTNEGTLYLPARQCRRVGMRPRDPDVHGAVQRTPHTLTVTGTDAAGNTATASRSWTVDTLGQTFAYTVGNTVSNGVPAAGAGNIEAAGASDTYTFTGTAGQKVFVDQLSATSCSLTWSLTGPGGATVFASRGICGDPGHVHAADRRHLHAEGGGRA